MNFKVLGLLLLSLLSLNISIAQNCKFDIDETDAFSGKSKKGIEETFYMLLNNGTKNVISTKKWGLAVLKEGNDYIIKLEMVFNGVIDDEIIKGDTLKIGLQGEKPITLISSTSVVPVKDVVDQNIFTTFTGTYPCSKEDLMKLSENKALAFLVQTSGNNHNCPIPDLKKVDKKIREMAVCMMNLE